MTNLFSSIGNKVNNGLASIGKAQRFLLGVLRLKLSLKYLGWLNVEIYKLGVLSLPIILLAGLFIGMVVSLQGYNTLDKFGSTSELGQLLALSIFRELGPVITALLFAGRAGSSLTAELGLMQSTEQISSMQMMGIDPKLRILSPRFFASLIVMPLLTTLFCSVAVIGGYLVGCVWLGLDDGIFWSNMRYAVSFENDVLGGLLKSFIFGFFISWIALLQGFFTKPCASGIAYSTTKTVVYASLLVLLLDFVLTTLMIGGW
jgi:phospholipid/cholesterol/gamma-HCH transport system permease protein